MEISPFLARLADLTVWRVERKRKALDKLGTSLHTVVDFEGKLSLSALVYLEHR